MKELLMYLMGGTFTAVVVYLIVAHGGASVDLVNATTKGAVNYVTALQAR